MTAMTRRDRVGASYVWVPPGAGLAGCWMLRTPVTNALWRAAVAAGVIGPPEDARAYDDPARAQHPVVYVTRGMARVYAAWVGGRLPRGVVDEPASDSQCALWVSADADDMLRKVAQWRTAMTT